MQTEDGMAIGSVPDAPLQNWVDRFAPKAVKPYLRLARLDRPIGFWLLFWPCAWSIALADIALGRGFNWWSIVLCLIGAIVMRGAGCTLNDIVDRDIDDKVARTRLRPIPSGQVKVWQAAAFLGLQALIGLVVLLQFNGFTIWLGVASLILVLIYPFMKRITYWPQLFLGLAFSYGALVGWASEIGSLGLAPVLLYVGTIMWTIGYDTIYALQDVEDDVLVGVKSTALLFGDKARFLVAGFYAGGFVLWIIAALLAGAGAIFVVAALVAAGILGWQVLTFDPQQPMNCLKRFKANHYVGLALMIAFWLEWVL